MKNLITLILLFSILLPSENETYWNSLKLKLNSNSLNINNQNDSINKTVNVGNVIKIIDNNDKEFIGELHSISYKYRENYLEIKLINPFLFSSSKIPFEDINSIQIGYGEKGKPYLKNILYNTGAYGALGYLFSYLILPPGHCGACGPQGGIPADYIRFLAAIIGSIEGVIIGSIITYKSPVIPKYYGEKLYLDK